MNVINLLNCSITNFLDNKLSYNNLASESVDNGNFLNQSQSNKLQLYDWLVYVITWGQVLLRINCTRVFKIFQNCPSREATRAIWKILKTQVQLILNSTRSHGITCSSIKGKIYKKENHARSLFLTHFKITNGCYAMD